MVSYHKPGVRRCRLVLLCHRGVTEGEALVFAPDDLGNYRKRRDKISDHLWLP